MPKIRYDVAAAVLLEALFTSDEKACAKYGIGDRQLRKYRVRLAEDPILQKLFKEKKALLDAAWADNLPDILRKAMQALDKCFASIAASEKAATDPQVLHALAGAFNIVAGAHLTSQVINDRFAINNRAQKGLPGEDIVESDNDYPLRG